FQFMDRAGREDGFVGGEDVRRKVGAGRVFGHGNAAFDLFAVYRAIGSAVGAAAAIVAQDEILVISKHEYSGKFCGEGVNALGEVRFNEHFAVNKDVSVLDMNHITGQTHDAFNGALFIFIAVINHHDIADRKST